MTVSLMTLGKGRGTRGTRSGLAEFGEHHVTELRAVVTPK